jgi:hypothetical protein
MQHEFDPGYGDAPFRNLVQDYPGPDVYDPTGFRTEWGPIFHRGRLDGSARFLFIGQDPAQTESITRRILCGTAGQRFQGFMARLGITRSYVGINTFLYSVYGQFAGEHNIDDKAITDYRNEWLDAICTTSQIDAVVGLGHLAQQAHDTWAQGTTITPQPAFVHMLHPTFPDSASASGQVTKKEAMKRLCDDWNRALDQLAGVVTPDRQVKLAHYGDALTAADLADIPERDLPAGLPSWMRLETGWAKRTGTTAASKRATITIKAPATALPPPA